MPKTYEIRVYEPAVDGGLFPRPTRWHYTRARQYYPDNTQGDKPLTYGEGHYWFNGGVADVYDPGSDTMTRAEIVGEIDEGRSMEVVAMTDRVITFVLISMWAFGVGVSIKTPETPAWFWAVLVVWGLTAFFMPELMADAERRGRRLAQWLVRNQRR